MQAKLVLVGRSALPPRAQWPQLSHGDDRQARQLRDLLALEQTGAELLVLSADVTDPGQMAHVRDEAIARFGGVHGVIHAAGVAGGTMVEAHSTEIASRVLAPKVTGTLVLGQVFEQDALDFLVLCSSVISVAGGLGQVDYCAANAFMDAFASSRSSAGARVYSVNWGGRLEVGMAVETHAPAAFRDIERGMRALTIDHPLLETGAQYDDDHSVTCSVALSAETHWALDEHRIHGTPVLPGTGDLEMVRAAFDRGHDGRPVELRDVVFVSPLAVADGESKDVRVVLEESADGTQFTVESVTEGRRQQHARGAVGWAAEVPDTVHDLDAIRGRCPRRRDEQGLAASASGMLTFGPRWSSLRRVFAGDGEELALLDAGAAVRDDLAALVLHPALLDEATAFGEFGSGEGQYLPLGYGRITVRAAMPPRIYSHLRYREGALENVILRHRRHRRRRQRDHRHPRLHAASGRRREHPDVGQRRRGARFRRERGRLRRRGPAGCGREERRHPSGGGRGGVAADAGRSPERPGRRFRQAPANADQDRCGARPRSAHRGARGPGAERSGGRGGAA